MNKENLDFNELDNVAGGKAWVQTFEDGVKVLMIDNTSKIYSNQVKKELKKFCEENGIKSNKVMSELYNLDLIDDDGYLTMEEIMIYGDGEIW